LAIITVWHGSLEMPSGQRFDFSTLAELERLLCELGGWVEPPSQALHQDEADLTHLQSRSKQLGVMLSPSTVNQEEDMKTLIISRAGSRVVVRLVVLMLAAALIFALSAAIVPGAPIGGGSSQFSGFVP
jgi:hypothetical protein